MLKTFYLDLTDIDQHSNDITTTFHWHQFNDNSGHYNDVSTTLQQSSIFNIQQRCSDILTMYQHWIDISMIRWWYFNALKMMLQRTSNVDQRRFNLRLKNMQRTNMNLCRASMKFLTFFEFVMTLCQLLNKCCSPFH